MRVSQGRFCASLIHIIGKLPLSVGRKLGKSIGWLAWLVPNRNRCVTQKNIELCFPELRSKERDELARKSLQHTGMLAFEMAAIWSKPYCWLEDLIVDVSGKELFDKAQQQQKGVILLLPHHGNWEVFGSYIPTLCNMMALYEPPQLPELEELIKQSRERNDATLVPTTPKGVGALLKHLQQGGTTCILPDQVPNHRQRGCVFAPFFNHPAHTMTLVTQLIQKTGCTVLGATAYRVSAGFKIVFSEPPADIYDADETVSATALNQLIKSFVKKIPEQYQWEYKRFRRVPEGGCKVY